MSVTEEKKFQRTISVNGVDQVFKYDTAEELSDLLTTAQENATKKIAEQAEEIKQLRRKATIGSPAATPASNGNGSEPASRFNPKQLTLEQLQALSVKIANPATGAEGVREAIELGLGADYESIRLALKAGLQVAHRDQQFAEGKKFHNDHPDFLLYSDADRMKIEADIYAWLQARKLPLVAENIGKAYEDLGANELLPPRPPSTPTTEEQRGSELQPGGEEANSSTRPRSFSSGVRRDTGTHNAPVVAKRSPQEVWAEIDAMDDATYERRMRDPAFRKMVDELPPR